MANTPRKAAAETDAPGADVPEPEADVSFASDAAGPTATSSATHVRTTAASNPATVAIAEAAHTAEIEQLRKERDELRERLGDAGGIDELVLLRAETDALRQAAAKAGLAATPNHMSEGVRQDLEMHGYAMDPGTGDALVLDRESGEVTVTPKRGRPTRMDMPEEPDIEHSAR